MRIYDTSNQENSLVHECWDLCDADNTSYPFDPDIVRRFNLSLEELVGMIINADGTWQFDDTNLTDAPRGNGDLVEGQEYYTFTSDYLQIEAIDILDTNSVYNRIKPLDPNQLSGLSPDEYFGIDSSGNPETGFPEYYDIKGGSIRLYKAPTATYVTLTDGIRISFKRTVDLFTTSDTIQEPGLPSTHHKLLAYMAAIPYCMKHHRDRVAWLEKQVMDMKRTLLDHYAFREKNKRAVITPETRAFR